MISKTFYTKDYLEIFQDVERHSLDINLTVSQWAELRRRIKPPGWKTYELFDFKKTPWLRDPCDSFSKNSPVRSETIVKGARLGFSQGLIMNSMFYNIDINPVKMFYVSADQKLLNNFAAVEIRPQLDRSNLSHKIRAASVNDNNKNKSTGQKAELWEFGSDGYIVFAGANNPNNFRQLGGQFIYLDERATYPIIRNEGDVYDLAIGRSNDYGIYAKIADVSTPTISGSEFEKEYLSGTQHLWMVPCPLCGALQFLEFGKFGEKDGDGKRELFYGLSFEHEAYELRSEIKYKCQYCGELFPESCKYDINNAGSWVQQNKTFRGENKSRKINSLYSNFFPWDELVNKFLKAKRSGMPSKLQAFRNLDLGEFWDVRKSETITVDQLMKDKSGYSRSEVPSEVGIITASCDVQSDRLEIEFKGWGRNKENYSIEYETLKGDTLKRDVWNDFEGLIFTKRFSGLAPLFYFVDEGDGKRVYEIRDFARRVNSRLRNETRNPAAEIIFTIKGQSPRQISNQELREVVLDDKLKRININTYKFKEIVYEWLKQKDRYDGEGEKPIGYPNFPIDYPRKYYSQLNSEHQVIDYDKAGYEKTSWVSTKTRNEALDLFCYNVAAIEYFCNFILKNTEKIHNLKNYDEMIEFYLNKRHQST